MKITTILCQDNNSDLHDKLKKEMGCEPRGDWDFLIQNDRLVQNMCVTKNYDPEKKPNGKNINSVTVSPGWLSTLWYHSTRVFCICFGITIFPRLQIREYFLPAP